jgi:hypothetical protein
VRLKKIQNCSKNVISTERTINVRQMSTICSIGVNILPRTDVYGMRVCTGYSNFGTQRSYPQWGGSVKKNDAPWSSIQSLINYVGGWSQYLILFHRPHAPLCMLWFTGSNCGLFRVKHASGCDQKEGRNESQNHAKQNTSKSTRQDVDTIVKSIWVMIN